MKFRLLTMFATVALVAACSTTPENTADTTGGGATTPMTDSGSAPAAPVEKMGAMDSFMNATGSDRVFFDYDKYDVKPEGRVSLRKWAVWLRTNPDIKVTVEGHCDERGTREYNLALGDRRANAVKEYLVSQGVGADRIKTISYGEERPANPASFEAAWAQNRRAVAVITGAGM